MAVVLAVGALSLLTRPALAQSAAPEPVAGLPSNAAVMVVPPSCPDWSSFDVPAFTSILTAELREDGVERVGASQAVSALASITMSIEPCAPTTHDVIVTIEDTLTSKRVARRILLQDVSDTAKPRALALAVAELLRASWLELVLPKAPPPATPVPPAVREAVLRRMASVLPPRELAKERDPDAALEGSLAIAWRAFPAGNASLLGARGAVAFPFYVKSLLLRFDGGAAYGTAHAALGDVHLGLASTGAALLYTTPLARTLTFAAGPRAELGVAWATGDAFATQTSSATGIGYVGSLSVLATGMLRLAPTWRLALELEGGGVFAPFDATADGQRVTGVRGGMFGLTVGLVSLY